MYSPSLAKVTKEAFTANDNSIGNSGGTTDVKMRVHSKKSL